MASRSVSRNNVVAGAFLLSAVALGVATSVVISDSLEYLKPMTRHVVEFTLAQGASGIKPGSAVTLGGQKVGRVTRIDFAGAEGDPRILVRLKVNRSVRLFKGAQINLERPLLGSTSEINITDVGDPDAGPADSVVPGVLGPPAFLAQAGFGPEQREKVRGVIDEIDRMVRRASDAVARIEPQVDPVVTDIRQTVEDVRAMVRDARERSPGWFDGVDRTIASAEAAAAKAPGIADDIDAGVAEARGVVASVQRVVDENTPGVNAFVRNIESASAKVDQQTVQAVNDAAAQAREALARFTDFLASASGKLEEQWPSVAKALANFRLASDQLKLLSVELREAPWRIFYQPKAKELESENILVAARTYAQAVSDLRAAGESLEAAARAGAATDPAALETMTQNVRAAFDRYRRAEQVLLDRLAAQEP